MITKVLLWRICNVYSMDRYVDAIATSSNPNMTIAMFNMGHGSAQYWAPKMDPVKFFRLAADIGKLGLSGLFLLISTDQTFPTDFWYGYDGITLINLITLMIV